MPFWEKRMLILFIRVVEQLGDVKPLDHQLLSAGLQLHEHGHRFDKLRHLLCLVLDDLAVVVAVGRPRRPMSSFRPSA